jgi:hypothetical protein
MAYVGIGDRLIHDVASKINNVCEAEIEARNLTIEPIDTSSISNWLIDKMWLGKQELISHVPAEWVSKTDKFDCRFVLASEGDTVVELKNKPYIGVVRFDAQTDIPVPLYTKSDYRPDVYVPIYEGEVLPETVQGWIDSVAARQDISMRWREVRNNVTAYLKNCKSLNEALKLWPYLRSYIPSEYLERVDRKSTKSEAEASKAEEFLKGIDVDSVQASAVMARLSGVNFDQ